MSKIQPRDANDDFVYLAESLLFRLCEESNDNDIFERKLQISTLAEEIAARHNLDVTHTKLLALLDGVFDKGVTTDFIDLVFGFAVSIGLDQLTIPNGNFGQYCENLKIAQKEVVAQQLATIIVEAGHLHEYTNEGQISWRYKVNRVLQALKEYDDWPEYEVAAELVNNTEISAA